MKLQLFAVLLVIVGSYALPRADVEPSNERHVVEDRIRRFIERISMRIQNAGLDPLHVERRDVEINVESVNLVVKAFVENLRFTGASDIRIHTLEYNHLFNRLRLDVSTPDISLTIGDAGLEARVLGSDIDAQLKGSFSIKSIRVVGVGYVDVNIIDGITLRSVSLNCSIGSIESDLSVVALGNDHSDFVNTLLKDKIHNFLENNKDDINRILERILSAILNRIWSF